MSAGAIVMLIISIVVVWGGLATAMYLLHRHPELPETDEAPADSAS
ncbi:putative methionine/alanine importer small subunit [Nocardiopsis gilva YIM 90087]|uniref:Putative methionine/alanine importer small subunit n=1 Tax=Nocardiopsis gilva YIM 90087 TaxID=1235441 RepID=A0A223S7A9_9ACTN|nr:methionine/alanine import family NSS transporter small subunit [Nocardiopsis gilva]ASU84003.1 putative methionine/alanine importer small subunit [Nocardiopsis gilva YIM 90087]